jgi:hypothetical protein
MTAACHDLIREDLYRARRATSRFYIAVVLLAGAIVAFYLQGAR